MTTYKIELVNCLVIMRELVPLFKNVKKEEELYFVEPKKQAD